MTKVYLRADENEAGATVEDWAGGDAWIRAGTSDGVILKDAEARAVVEGLLRRMLERAVPGEATLCLDIKRLLKHLEKAR